MKTQPSGMLAGALLASGFIFSPLAHPQQSSGGQPLAKEAVLSSLSTKLDTKKTKVGDAVVAKTLNPLTLNDGTIVPAGSKLTGKVTQVQSKSTGTATLAIEFDELEKKGGTSIPVHGSIAAIAPLPDSGGGGGAANNDLPMKGTSAQNAAMTGMSMGPGGGEAPIPTGSSIKGVELKATPAADGSSVMESAAKDIKLEGGTRLEIGLTAPAK